MRWLSLVHLRVHLQAGFHVAGPQVADFHAGGSQAADFHAAGLQEAADSTAHRCPGVGSAVEAVVPGRRPLRAPQTYPGQEGWLRKAILPAAVPNLTHRRARRIFPSQGLASQEA
jgi:hypothetical protein